MQRSKKSVKLIVVNNFKDLHLRGAKENLDVMSEPVQCKPGECFIPAAL